MINPFRYTYQITEYKNANGETKFLATYSNVLCRIFSHLENVTMYIESEGVLYDREFYGSHSSLEDAKQAIENHKLKAIEKQNAKYKKLAIHYVE